MNTTTFDIVRIIRDARNSVERPRGDKPLVLAVSFDVYFELKRVMALPSGSRLTDLYGMPVMVSPKLAGFTFAIQSEPS